MTSTGSDGKEGKITTPLHFYDPHASQRAQIERQILLLKQQIQRLEVARNGLLPISSLPNEILSNIFLTRRPNYDAYEVKMRGLLTLTWVCHHWRNVALATAPLWSYIGKENFHWAAESLIRSKQAPLDGILDRVFDDPSTFDIDALVLSQIHRFRRMKLSLGRHQRSDAAVKLGPVLTQPAPMLEVLELGYVAISTPLFSGMSPLLHTVRLSWGRIKWTPKILPFIALKNLQIIYPATRFSVTTFVQTLPPSLPHLETLELIRTFNSLTPPRTHPPTRVSFPNLKVLRLWGSGLGTLSQFFEFCSFSLLAEVNVDVTPDEGETVSGFLDIVRASGGFDRRPFFSVDLKHRNSDEDTLFIRAQNTEDDKNPISLTLPTQHLPWSDIIQNVTTLPIQRLTKLTLGTPQLSNDDWARVFVPFVNLEALSLDDELTVESFIRFIVFSTPDNLDEATVTDSITSQLPFNSLREIELWGYDFGSEVESHADFLAFCHAMKVRRRCGVKLKELWVRDYMLYLDLLREGADELRFLY
ncbi:hypothetical protein BDN72DRAFT_841080 [Pluteus cervinus]|uniref:Uncharacterized protein n=1 Tax=Pluteus cervinus TaxID=181527 RepID=A0ACD3ATM9_9AGAR|nr:hypothetical protein BDN72DRAFT_841080 [Pluteus cervinus]